MVRSVSPTNGPPLGGTEVTITGKDFPAAVDSVCFGTVRLAGLVRESATELTGRTPAQSAGPVDVAVFTSVAGSRSCRQCFTYSFGPPANVVVSPRDTSIVQGRTFQLRVAIADSLDETIPGVAPTFSSTDTTILRVSPSGVVTGAYGGDAFVDAIVQSGASRIVIGTHVTVADTTLLAHVVVGGQPFDIGIGPVSAYVTNLIGVVRLDLATLTSGARVTGTFSTPTEVTFSAAGDVAYVSNEYGRQISVVNTAANMVVDSIRTTLGPIPLTVSGTIMFAATSANYLYRIDLTTNRATASIGLPGTANHLLVRPSDTTVYVAVWRPYGQDTGKVLVVDGRTMQVTKILLVGGHPQAMVLSPDLQTMYLANDAAPYLYVIALSLGTVTDAIPLVSPAFGLAISPDGARLYVGLANPVAGKIQVIDRATRTVVRWNSVAGTPREIRYDAAHQHVLVANEGGWVDVFAP